MATDNQRPSKSNKPKLSIKEKKAAKKAKKAAGRPNLVVPKPKPKD